VRSESAPQRYNFSAAHKSLGRQLVLMKRDTVCVALYSSYNTAVSAVSDDLSYNVVIFRYYSHIR